jgi:hypothetical protein
MLAALAIYGISGQTSRLHLPSDAVANNAVVRQDRRFTKDNMMETKSRIWIAIAAFVAVPALAAGIAAQPPAAPLAKPVEPAKPEATKQASKEAIAAQERIDVALKKIDKSIKRNSNVWQFTLGKREVIVITDPVAERMRIMVPIVETKELDQPLLTRLMQANFESALDARYAIAQDVLWGVFIHPLSSLSERDFVSGLAQALTVAETYGATFSSGVLVFGGGDTPRRQAEDLLNELRRQSEAGKKNAI